MGRRRRQRRVIGFGTDLDLIRWQPHALKGKDAYTYRGLWTSPLGWTSGSVTTPFVMGDGVFYNGKLWTVYFTPTTTHTAPGTEAGPGVTASPWSLLMSNFPFLASDVKDVTENKRQNVINSELRTEIANIKRRLTAAGIA